MPPALWSPRNVTSAALTVVLPLARVFFSTTFPALLSAISPCRALRLPRFTPTPVSLETRRIRLAYMPPSAPVSTATFGAVPSPFNALTLPSAATRFAPATTRKSFACSCALISVAREMIDTASLCEPLRPAPSMVTAPWVTSRDCSLPLASSTGLPVVRVTFGVLINPQPLQVIP